MIADKYSTLTLGDCLTLMDQLDGALAIMGKAKQLSPAEIGIKSMLTVIRREVADQVLEITRASLPRNPPSFRSKLESRP